MRLVNAWQLAAAALVAVGAAGCRDEEREVLIPGETQTTSAEETTAQPAAPTAPAPVAEPPPKQEQAAGEQEQQKAKSAKKPATAKKKTATSATTPRDTRGEPEGARDPWDQPPIVGTTTVTGAELGPEGEQEGAAAEQPAEPEQAKEGGYVNHSTTLGDGTSGMYTGGEGTYGGRATWGTGGGAAPSK